MNARARELASQKAELVYRITDQRGELRLVFGELDRGLRLVDRGVAAARWIAGHPWTWVAGIAGIATILLVRPRSMMTLIRGGLTVALPAFRLVRSLAARHAAQEEKHR